MYLYVIYNKYIKQYIFINNINNNNGIEINILYICCAFPIHCS